MGGGTVASGRVSSPRHVLLNALFLDPAASGGPETYLRGLAPALHAARPDVKLTIATTRAGAAALRGDGWDAWAAIRELPCDEGQRGRRQLPEPEVRERYAIGDRRVVLCVASKRPHKNQALLVRAAQDLGDDVAIVLAGHPEPYDAELRALAGDLGVREKIRF